MKALIKAHIHRFLRYADGWRVCAVSGCDEVRKVVPAR